MIPPNKKCCVFNTAFDDFESYRLYMLGINPCRRLPGTSSVRRLFEVGETYCGKDRLANRDIQILGITRRVQPPHKRRRRPR